MYAPAYLPQGAVVTKVTAYVYDNDDSCASPNISVRLRRVELASGSYYEMSLVSTSGASGSVQTIVDDSVSYATIDNINYAYFVFVYICSDAHHLNGVAISYVD